MKQQTYYDRRPLERLQRLATSLVALGTLVLSLSVLTWGQSAYVRVNQVGYVSTVSKRAYLMTATTETGATFSVKNSAGTSVYSAPIGANQGSWGTFTYVYTLDFDSVSAAGTYTISVTGPAPTTSVPFKIDTGANLYTGALSNTLKFYQTERDGPNFIPNALRTAAGHLNDQSATAYFTPAMNKNGRFSGSLTPTGAVIDASGGWWDAGDYLEFVQTHSYTVGMMLLGVRDFPNQMGSGSAPSNFTGEATFGLDWLQKMWSDSNQTLYYQKALGEANAQHVADHDIWRLPETDDTYGGCAPNYIYICHRPVLINPAGGSGAKISPNLAGRLAADFAECFQVFKTSNPTYADQCLLSAEHVFDLADTAPGQLVTAAPYSFYPEVEWRDDLEWGAAELYFALSDGGLPSGLPHTDPMFYLTAAANWANACIGESGCEAEPLNLYTVSQLAHFELYRAITKAGNPSGLAITKTQLLNDMNLGLQKALSAAATDPFGFGAFYAPAAPSPWAHYDTTSFGGGLVVMAWMYDNVANTNTYAPYASRWQANVLGANAWGISQIIGLGTTFSHCPSHQVANLAGSLDGTEPRLDGAAGEGPNSFASKGLVTGMVVCPPNGVDVFAPFNNGTKVVYADNQQSYSTDEPAIDLTASSFLSFSWAIAGAPSGTP